MKSKQKNFPIDWGINQLNSFSVSEGFKKSVENSTLASKPPTHPPSVEKNKKNVVFLGFLAHLEQKNFFEVFSPWKFLNLFHLWTDFDYWRSWG